MTPPLILTLSGCMWELYKARLIWHTLSSRYPLALLSISHNWSAVPSTRRPAGTIPAAFSKSGQDVPPSPDVAERTLADVIGESAALHLAEIIGPLLEHIATTQYRPACIVCAAAAKRAEKAHKVAIANANAAAEDGPEVPDLGVTESFTEGARGPVCWGCYDPDIDGPYDLGEFLPPSVD